MRLSYLREYSLGVLDSLTSVVTQRLAVVLPSPSPLWIPAFAGIQRALRRPHKRMKMMVRRAVFSIVWWSYPSPPLLDSSLRWNDEISRGSMSRIVVRDMLS